MLIGHRLKELTCLFRARTDRVNGSRTDIALPKPTLIEGIRRYSNSVVIKGHRPPLTPEELEEFLARIDPLLSNSLHLALESYLASTGSHRKSRYVPETGLLYWRIANLIDEARSTILSAKTIVIIGDQDGLGDSVVNSRLALAMAKHWPDKKIVFTTRNPELFSLYGLPNLVVTDEKLFDIVTKVKLEEPNNSISLYNPTNYKLHNDKQLLAFSRSSGVPIFPATDVGQTTLQEIPTVFSSEIPWEGRDRCEKQLFQLPSQLSQQVTLKLLFGITETTFESPINLSENLNPIFDLIIVYDAYEGDRSKMLSVEMWFRIITNILHHYPNMKIGIIKGIHHNDWLHIYRKINNQGLPVQFTEGSIEHLNALNSTTSGGVWIVRCSNITDVTNAIGSARCCASVDTGPMHVANAIMRCSKNKILKELVAIFGSYISSSYWLTEKGNTIIFPDMGSVDYKVVLNEILTALQNTEADSSYLKIG